MPHDQIPLRFLRSGVEISTTPSVRPRIFPKYPDAPSSGRAPIRINLDDRQPIKDLQRPVEQPLPRRIPFVIGMQRAQHHPPVALQHEDGA
jgi:hypothetical protein